MKTGSYLRAVLLGGAMISASAAWAIDSKTFITNAIQGNLAEISVGQLAQERGSTDAVKNLGKTLVDDHSKANQDATTVASGMGVTPPTAPDAAQRTLHDKLSGESGHAFDRDFLDAMLTDHKKDVADYKTVADNNKDAVGSYAAKTLPALQGHLDTIQKLHDSMGNTMAQNTMSGGMAGLENGANSFTEGQAKERIEKAGFSGVSALKKDDQGIWRGTATKNGQSMSVGVDFKGNVAGK